MKDVMKGKGGEIKTKQLAGHLAYFATGTQDDNGWITWTRSGVPIAAGSEAWLAATIDPKAAKIAPELADQASRADHGRMVWGAMVLEPGRARDWGLPDGLIASPVGVRAGADFTDEIDLDLLITFKTADEARRAAELLRAQIGQLRQTPVGSAFLSNVRLGVHGTELRAMIHLDARTTASILGAIKVT
jgi:hypothetical protein